MYLRREVVWVGFGVSVLFVAAAAAWEIRADSAASAPPTGISVVLEGSEGNSQGTTSSAKTQVVLDSSSPTASNTGTTETSSASSNSPITTGTTTPAVSNRTATTTVPKQAPTTVVAQTAIQAPTTIRPTTLTQTQAPTTTTLNEWCYSLTEAEAFYYGAKFSFEGATFAGGPTFERQDKSYFTHFDYRFNEDPLWRSGGAYVALDKWRQGLSAGGVINIVHESGAHLDGRLSKWDVYVQTSSAFPADSDRDFRVTFFVRTC